MDLVCVACKKSKDETLFSFKNRKIGKRSSRCKECHKDYMKNHYEQNKITYKQRARKSNIVYKEEVSKFLTNIKLNSKCNQCGENHPATLDFHHVDDETKEFNISVPQGRSMEKIKKEIDKCIILCSNCHRKLHWSEKYKNAPVAQ
jgi:hypothetical protein